MFSIPTYGDDRRAAIGLLGGSFNPAHAGHLQLARYALTHLRLDQVWLMVTPGNPLKPREGMASFADRLRSAEAIADGRCIVATDIEMRLGARYTVESLRRLKLRFPRARFVWLMGADSLANFSRWRRWRRIASLMPLVILPRPGSNADAIASRAASWMRHIRRPARRAPVLSRYKGDAWTFLPAPQNGISATALRDSGITAGTP